MAYLDFEEYSNMGGVLDMTAFNRNIDRASAMIDFRTHNRIVGVEEIPHLVKVVCVDLVEYISNNKIDRVLASRSQSAGGVSESENYIIKTASEYSDDLNRIFEPLATITTKNGVSLLYKGAMC